MRCQKSLLKKPRFSLFIVSNKNKKVDPSSLKKIELPVKCLFLIDSAKKIIVKSLMPHELTKQNCLQNKTLTLYGLKDTWATLSPD